MPVTAGPDIIRQPTRAKPAPAGSQPAKAKSMEITLLGQKIPIRTTEKDSELVVEAVSLASMLLKNAELRVKGGGAVAHQVALLALLDLSQEYVKARRRTAVFKRNVTEKTARLTGLVQDCLK